MEIKEFNDYAIAVSPPLLLPPFVIVNLLSVIASRVKQSHEIIIKHSAVSIKLIAENCDILKMWHETKRLGQASTEFAYFDVVRHSIFK